MVMHEKCKWQRNCLVNGMCLLCPAKQCPQVVVVRKKNPILFLKADPAPPQCCQLFDDWKWMMIVVVVDDGAAADIWLPLLLAHHCYGPPICKSTTPLWMGGIQICFHQPAPPSADQLMWVSCWSISWRGRERAQFIVSNSRWSQMTSIGLLKTDSLGHICKVFHQWDLFLLKLFSSNWLSVMFHSDMKVGILQ